MSMVTLFRKYAPEWDGTPLSAVQSVEMMLAVVEKAGPADSGSFLSQYGTKQWL